MEGFFFTFGKNPSSNFSVANHRLSFDHDFEWDEPNILHKEQNRKKERDCGNVFE